MQLLIVIGVGHLGLELLVDLRELAHDEGEGGDADHHAEDADDAFEVAHGEQVAITDRGEHGQRKIQTHNQLVRFFFISVEAEFEVPRGLALDRRLMRL